MLKEEQLILLLSTRVISEEAKTEIRSLAAASDISWSLFLRLASGHKIENFIYSNIRTNQLSGLLPAKVEGYFKSIYYQVSIRNARFKEIIENISTRCHKNKIVLVKGSALLYDFYNDIGARRLADVDILINKSDRDSVWKALTGGGWNSDDWAGFKSKAHALVNDAQYKTMHYLYYGDVAEQIFIDIHWKFYIGAGADNAAEYAMQSCRKVQDNLYVHSDEMQIIHLCCNNYLDYTNGGVMYLRNLCDINEFIKARQINWNRLTQILHLTSGDDFMTRAVTTTLNAISRLFGTAIPVQFQATLFEGITLTPMSILMLPVTILKKTGWHSFRDNLNTLGTTPLKLQYLFKEVVPDHKWLRGTYKKSICPLCAYWSYMFRRHILHKKISFNE